MHRVDTATAVAAPPALDAAVSPGYFSKGNPATGVPATIPGQDWFNSVQEELVSIIAAAGITLDRTANNQVLAALQSMFAGGDTHQKILGGLIFQWGTYTATAATVHTITLPIAFPTVCYHFSVTPVDDAYSLIYRPSGKVIAAVPITQAKIGYAYGGGGGQVLNWFAIGK
jgi:hypothetical protein